MNEIVGVFFHRVLSFRVDSFFSYEMDGTGCSVFAIYLWIFASQTFLALIDVIFGTPVCGLSQWVTFAFSHIAYLIASSAASKIVNNETGLVK